MKGARGIRIRTVKERTLIATVDIGLKTNTGYCTTLEGGDTKLFKFDNTKEGFEKFWCMTMASRNNEDGNWCLDDSGEKPVFARSGTRSELPQHSDHTPTPSSFSRLIAASGRRGSSFIKK
jgi:hypothetical protein